MAATTTIIGTTLNPNVPPPETTNRSNTYRAGLSYTPKEEDPVMTKFRKELMKRGEAMIKNISMTFRQCDNDESGALSFQEFRDGLANHNIQMKPEEVKKLFGLFDKDKGDTIDYEEFLNDVKLPMNTYRLDLVKKAFEKMDKTGDKKITVEDLKGVYSVKKHPKYLNGEWTEDKCLSEFLNTFDVGQHKDGVVTFEEFCNYYHGVSASIDSDVYFDCMMRKCWNLS